MIRTLLLASLATLSTACGESAVAPSDAASSAAAPGSFRGTIQLAPGIEPGEHAALLVMGRRDPEAVLPDMLLRLPASPLPREFVLDARHMLNPGKVAGEWTLTARLDADGEVLATRDDVEGSLRRVSPGTAGLELVLDTPVTRTEDAAALGMPSGHPQLDGPATAPPLTASGELAPPAGHTQPVAQPARIEGPRYRGTIALAPAHADRGGSGTLFLIAKTSPQARGMPAAVFRVDAPRFPLEFDLGPEHVPLAVENKADLVAGPLHLIARLDADGDAISKLPSDIESAWLELEADQEAVTIVIDRSRS